MRLEELQQEVDTWIKTYGKRYFHEMTNLGILMEEVGELSRIMVRTYGEQSYKRSDEGKDLGQEMADILWVLTALANQCGIHLEEEMKKNFERKTKRDSRRHLENKKLDD